MHKRTSRLHVLAWIPALAASGCGNADAARRALEHHADAAPAATPTRLVACKLMTAQEMSALTGQSLTSVDAVDDAKQTSSECHYRSDVNPAGASLTVQWISSRDYSNPVEHAALQKASIAGARLAGSLTGSIANTSGMRSGPVTGVGDEAFVSLGLLTARKGDVTIMVQIIPTDMMAFVKDTAVSGALIEQEKAVALKVISQL
jgi:hypothetical protein